MQLDAKDEHGWNALHYAAFAADTKIVELVLLRGGKQLLFAEVIR